MWAHGLLCCIAAVLVEIKAKSQRPEEGGEWLGADMPRDRVIVPGLAVDTSDLLAPIWSNNTGEFAPATCELPAGSQRASGICYDKYEEVRSQLTFCHEAVQYRVCVPAHQPLWENWNASAKDRLLAKMFQEIVQRRIRQEANVTPYVYVKHKFLANPDCIAAFKNVLCWYNFPKCSDDNISLPLCTRSCQRFLEACRYDVTDGMLSPVCEKSYPRHHGLFGIGVHTPDQILEDDTASCGSTLAYAQTIPLEITETAWYATPWGAILIAIGVTILIYIVSVFNVPEGLRAFVKWQVLEIILIPYNMWMRLPTFRGRSLLVQFGAVAFLLVALGALRRFGPAEYFGGGLDRFSSDMHKPKEEKEFNPNPSIFMIDATKPIKGLQLRQLVASCTCTGAGHRLAEPDVVTIVIGLVVASVSVWKRNY